MSLSNASQKTCITTFYQTCMVCAAASDFLLYRFSDSFRKFRRARFRVRRYFIDHGAMPRK